MDVLVDTIIHIHQSSQQKEIGSKSPYTTQVHPGSNKVIKGWQWDKRVWPTAEEFNSGTFAPSIWNPDLSVLTEDYYQSGYGDNNDLLLLDIENEVASGSHTWTPQVHRGFYYIYDTEWILYSDLYQQEYFDVQNTVDSEQFLDMRFDYRLGLPLQVRSYLFNSLQGRHFVDQDFRKVVEFTTSGTGLEFKVDTDYSPPRVWLNGEYSTEIAGPVDTVSGFPVTADLQALEKIGISDGTDSQQFYTSYSPIDLHADVELWSWGNDLTLADQWDLISGIENFTDSGMQAWIDRDHGIVQFGNWDPVLLTGAGFVPEIGHSIAMYYTKGVALNYEPYFGNDIISARHADLRPIANSTNQGFVQVLTEASNPAQITLTAELSIDSSSNYEIDLGNNTGRLIATVHDAAGGTLEGEEVTFSILDPIKGTFGTTRTTVSAITNNEGRAYAIYNAPKTIDDMGQATQDITISGDTTVIEVDGLTAPSSLNSVYIYKVHEYDLVLGIPVAEVSGSYDEFFAEDNITTGTTFAQAWEEEHRTINDLQATVTYETTDISTGKKTILLTQTGTDIVNPHTGEFTTGTWSPLFASSITDIGTSSAPIMQLEYDVGLPDIGLPIGDGTKSYFVIGDAKTQLQAYVTNSRNNKNIYSNTIGMKITIPDTLNGTYFADLLSTVEDGTLTNTTDVDALTDSEINTTSGVGTYWEDYLEEQLPFSYVQPAHTVYIRAKKVGTDPTPSLQISLRNLTTGRATWLTEVDNTEYQTYAWQLTIAEINSLTSYADLNVRLWKLPVTISSDIHVSWVQLYVGHAPGATPEGLVEQKLRPVSNSTPGDWSPDDGTAYLLVNEFTFNDQDEMYSKPYTEGNDYSVLDLASGTDPRGVYDDYEDYAFWFRRTRRGDTAGMLAANLGLETVSIDPSIEALPGVIPLGFRLRSTGITLASVLDQVTYIDPNDHLPSGYFGV